MRQAGRYLPEYRAVREGVGFLEMCADVDRAVEVSLQPIRLVGSEAVVFFCDIFVPLVGLGLPVRFGPGPIVDDPIRSGAQVAALPERCATESVPYVFEILKRLRRELAADRIPLIGFAGAPFTLATYLIEGRGDPTRRYAETHAWREREPEGFRALLEWLADRTIDYLNAQIDAGAQVVQLFDSWAGALDADTYRQWILPINRRIADGVDRTRAPFILFTNEAPHLLDPMLEVAPDVISVGAAVDLARAAERAQGRISLQGNLDPEELKLSPELIFQRVREICLAARAARGHVLNLGHGCTPDTPVEGVRAFTEAARALARDPEWIRARATPA